MLLAASFAMLTACAALPSERPKPAADPVVRTVVRTERVCPAELTAPSPAQPQPGADAKLTGNSAGMAWLSAMLAWANLINDRLADARKECP